METLSFQAPESMKKRLEAAAKKLDRSKAYLIRCALEEYLEDLQDYLEVTRYKRDYDPASNISLATLKRKHKLK